MPVLKVASKPNVFTTNQGPKPGDVDGPSNDRSHGPPPANTPPEDPGSDLPPPEDPGSDPPPPEDPGGDPPPTEDPEAQLEVPATAPSGSCVAGTLSLAHFSGTTADFTVTVTPRYVGAGTSPSTPQAFLATKADCSDIGTQLTGNDIPLTGGGVAIGFYYTGYNLKGDTEVKIDATVTAGTTLSANATTRFNERSGFMIKGATFAETPPLLGNGHGWNTWIDNTARGRTAVVANRANDPGAEVYTAMSTFGYPLLFTAPPVDGNVADPLIPIGVDSVGVFMDQQSRYKGFSANAAAPVQVSAKGPGSFVTANATQEVFIGAAGDYDICGSGDGSPIYLVLGTNSFVGRGTLSIWVSNAPLNVRMETNGGSTPTDDYFIAGPGLQNLFGNNTISVGGNLTWGSLRTGHTANCP